MRLARSVPAGTLILALLGGCNCGNDQAKDKGRRAFSPAEQYPEWAFDAPFYYRPAKDRGDVGEEVAPAAPGAPPHFYVRNRTIFLPRPDQESSKTSPMPEMGPRTTPFDLAPRIAVYWTEDAGQTWTRAGYFGVGQTHFAFPVDNDGSYGFRFVGPGLPVPKCTPPRPQAVYHVDTEPPALTLYIEPNLPAYQVDQSVKIHWMAADAHLTDAPVSVCVCWGEDELGKPSWTDVASKQPAEGSATFVIPARAAGERIGVRGEAWDRSGNRRVGPPVYIEVAQASVATMPGSVVTPIQPAETPRVTVLAVPPVDPGQAAAMKSMVLTAGAEPASYITERVDPPSLPQPHSERTEIQPTAIPSLVEAEAAKPTMPTPQSKDKEPTLPRARPLLSKWMASEPAQLDHHWSSRPWESPSDWASLGIPALVNPPGHPMPRR
ncbi:MAG: hypothetical protein JXQ73_08190 [Phycisphaerae bacterium]|nr:hypothetical protein [Phycisphaerae bacterium]